MRERGGCVCHGAARGQAVQQVITMIAVQGEPVCVEHHVRQKEHNTGEVAGKLLDKVASADQSRHVHVSAEVAVLDGNHPTAKRARLYEARDRIARGLSRYRNEGKRALPKLHGDVSQTLPLLGEQAMRIVKIGAHHADAVVELGVPVVPCRGRHLDTRIEVELVGELEHGATRACTGALPYR